MIFNKDNKCDKNKLHIVNNQLGNWMHVYSEYNFNKYASLQLLTSHSFCLEQIVQTKSTSTKNIFS